jgi:TetR/AcrR family transcriptional repressor of nem operon
VSVPALMAEAGLTHGAFYGQFASKEALAAAACTAAFAEKRTFYDELAERASQGDEDTRAVYVKRYTKASHRDERGDGCPIPALCGDVAREDMKGPVRSAFVAGLNSLIERLPEVLARGGRKASREEALATLSLLVGALLLSRASDGSPLSEEFLASARGALLSD